MNEWVSFAMGALRWEERDGYTFFSRFTPAQDAFNLPRGYEVKGHASAGMKLEFDTAARAISFDYRIEPGSSRPFYTIDLLVNGQIRKSVHKVKVPDEDTFSVSLEEGEKRVCLCFPNLDELAIKNLTADAPLAFRRREKKILVLGDSITQGYDAHHPALSYANLLADALDAEILNQALGGDVFTADLLDPDLPFAPDMITVAYGTNDWRHRDDVAAPCEEFFARLRALYPNTAAYAILPVWRMGYDDDHLLNQNGKTLAQIRAEIASIARRHGVIPLDGTHFVPSETDFYSDGLHPNDLGFVFYAKNLISAITK